MNSQNPDVPKIIWMMWLQGYDQAPDLVRTCIDSWRSYHPEWQLHILDKEAVSSLIDLTPLHLERHNEVSPAAFSDIIRINLLEKYGGVWVDATCLCQAPLESWLEPCLKSGFFAFRNAHEAKALSSWFLVATRESYIVSRQCALTNAYWSENCFINPKRSLLRRLLSKGLRNDPRLFRFWFTPFATRILKIHPYFWFHYIFCGLLRKDSLFSEAWLETPSLSAVPLERIQKESLQAPIRESLREELDRQSVPLFKLNWRHAQAGYAENSALSYVLRTWTSR